MHCVAFEVRPLATGKNMSRASKNSAPSQRMLRIGELVRHAMSQILQRGDIMDPVIETAVITVPEVRMASDLKLAKIYIMPLGGANAEEVVKALNGHQKYIRGKVAPKLGLKFTPELKFYVDDTFEEADRIDSILRSDKVKGDLAVDEDATGDDGEN